MNAMKNNLLGLCIMAGLVVLGCAIPASVKIFKSYDRTVSVKGLCEREVAADKVIWPLVFKVAGNQLPAVSGEIAEKTGRIEQYLRNGGVEESEITVAMPKISDKDANEYGGNDRTYRYVATCTVTVCSQDVQKVLALMADRNSLIDEGIVLSSDWDSTPQFRFEGLNDIKPEMIEEATKNAREVALKFAKDSDSSLGKIKDAAQGTFSIEDRDSNTPSIKKVRVVTYVTYYLEK